jgi:ABC-type multidrug transport system fused ATPase/permease subunit
VSKADPRFTGKYSSEVLETLKFAYGRFLFPIVGLALLGWIGRVLLLFNANIVGYWVDSLCKAPQQCKPVPHMFQGLENKDFVLILLLVTTAGFVLTTTFRISFSRFSSQAVSLFYDEVTLRTSRLPIRFFDVTPVGAIVTRFSNDYGNVFRIFGGPLSEYFIIIFDLTSMFVLIGAASMWYWPLVILIGFCNYGIWRLNRDRLREERRELSAVRGPAIAHFSETTQGASTVRVFSRQRSFFERFEQLNDAYLARRKSTYKASLSFSYQMNSLSALLLLLTGISGIYFVNHGWVSVGSVGVAFTFIVLSTVSIQMFFEWMSQFEEAMTGVERLDHYLRLQLEPGLQLPVETVFPTPHPKRKPDENLSSPFVGKKSAVVHFENIKFRYNDDLPLVLNGIDFTVQAGERLGIVGRTGSGKSSLIQALFHLYPIESGRISIDGFSPRIDANCPTAPNEVDLSVFRQAIAFIAQEPTLFRGTLRENLSLGKDCSVEQLKNVLAKVDLLSWLDEQEEGLNMFIDERGRNLSLGERQLLCMARCLLQDAPVIVLDEATSAIDPQSEEILVRATGEFFKDRTQLIIAHRLSTLEACDKILWLKEGEVYKLGPAQSILQELRRASDGVTATY